MPVLMGVRGFLAGCGGVVLGLGTGLGGEELPVEEGGGGGGGAGDCDSVSTLKW